MAAARQPPGLLPGRWREEGVDDDWGTGG